ncbi:DUF397 domain-containing protein [Streptomyces sp. NPDC056909]|uniref:DUF397 domain-containing protein n=1 Tax=unclassified Streptomyces TaxID=2593676 RepID=UPI0034232868|nr:DUF397 domain-containing protein [Streptomyces sp. NBC_00872]
MQSVGNGVAASSLDVMWVKSRRSAAEGNCVELAPLPGGSVAVRNSRDPQGPALVYTAAEVTAFLAGVKDGDFDHLL